MLPSLSRGTGGRVQFGEFPILRDGVSGAHAELVAVPAENVYAKPHRLSWDQAAPLPLAGVTAWRALISQVASNPVGSWLGDLQQ